MMFLTVISRSMQRSSKKKKMLLYVLQVHVNLFADFGRGGGWGASYHGCNKIVSIM